MWLVKSGIDKKEKKRLVNSDEKVLLECGTRNTDYDMVHAEYMGTDEAALLPGINLDLIDYCAECYGHKEEVGWVCGLCGVWIAVCAAGPASILGAPRNKFILFFISISLFPRNVANLTQDKFIKLHIVDPRKFYYEQTQKSTANVNRVLMRNLFSY